MGPSLCWGAETQGKRLWTQALERSRGLWLPWKRERSSKGTDRGGKIPHALNAETKWHWICPWTAPCWWPFTGRLLSLQLGLPIRSGHRRHREQRAEQSVMDHRMWEHQRRCHVPDRYQHLPTPWPARLRPEDTAAVCWASRCPGHRSHRGVRSLVRSAPGPVGRASLPALAHLHLLGWVLRSPGNMPGYPQLWPDAETRVCPQVCCQKEEPRSKYWTESWKGLPPSPVFPSPTLTTEAPRCGTQARSLL